MFNKVYSFRASVPIPNSIPPDIVVRALQKPENLLDLGSLLYTYNQIPTESLPEKVRNDTAHFSRFASTSPVIAYEVTDTIQMIPGAGPWATKFIKFFARFQNMPNGIRAYVNASAGVNVRSEYRVDFKEGSVAKANNGQQEQPIESGWYLVEKSAVECFALMMPLVAWNLEASHKGLLEELLAKVEEEQGQSKGSGDTPPQKGYYA